MFMRSGYSAQTRSACVGERAALAGAATSGTKHHDDAADVIVGRLDSARRLRRQPGRDPLALELLRAHAIELDDVALARGARRLPRPAGGNQDPFALDSEAAPAPPPAGGSAKKESPVLACRPRRGASVPGRAVEGLELDDDRARQQSPGTQMGSGTLQERRAIGRSAKQLDRLHRHDAQAEVSAAQLQLPRVPAERLNAHPGRALSQRVEQSSIELERAHLVPGTSKIERDTTRACANVEYRIGNAGLGRASQLPPERKIGAVMAALEVVPRDRDLRAVEARRALAVLALGR